MTIQDNKGLHLIELANSNIISSILDVLGINYSVIDSEGNYIAQNNAMIDNISSGKINAEQIDRASWEDCKRVMQSMKRVVREEPFNGRYYLSVKQPLIENGQCLGIIVASFDISDRKQQEKELFKAKEQAEAANQAKSDFLSIMGHELRKPLGNVLGLAYLLKDTPLNKEQTHLVELISSTANAVMPALSYTHEFLNLEEGYEPYDEPQSVIKIVEASAKNSSLATSGSDVNFYIYLQTEFPAKLLFDAYRVKQALDILIANGLRFTAQGYVCVYVGFNPEKNLIEITIQDSGSGMSTEKLDSLYGDHEIRTCLEAGLRTSLARKIVEALHGKIWAESELGQYTKVHLEIPCKMLPKEKLAEIQSNNKPVNLVLVEQDPVSLDIYQNTLKNQGFIVNAVDYHVDKITSLLNAITAETDIVMVNDNTPDLRDLLNQIKTHIADFKTKLVVYSSSAKRDAPDIGDNVYFLRAPICPSEIVDQINLSHTDRAKFFKRALVVEDDVIFQNVIKKMLRNLGFHVDAVSSGREALSALTKESYGYIFLDIELPDINGFTLAPKLMEIIKKRGHYRLTKIIAVTSHTLQAMQINFRERGISKLVGKPLSVGLLSEVIEEVRDGDDDDDD